jgi:hypothetical protein
MEADIDMEMSLYKRLQDTFGDEYDPTFFVAAKYKVTDRYQVYVHNMKLL